MRGRLGDSFPFAHEISGDDVRLTVEPCGLAGVVGKDGAIGKHVLCQLYHEYWAGMLSSFLGKQYGCETAQATSQKCVMNLTPK